MPRSFAFYGNWTLAQWLRLAGDTAFLGGGLLLADLVKNLRHPRRAAIGDGEPLPTSGPQPAPWGSGF